MAAEALAQDITIPVLQERIAELQRDVNGYAVLLEQRCQELEDARSTIEALDRRIQERCTEVERALARVVVAEEAAERWQQGVRDANRIAQRFEAEREEARRDATRARLEAAMVKAQGEDLRGQINSLRAQLRIVEAQRDAATAQRDDARAELEAMLPAQPVVLDMVPRPSAQPVVLVPDPALDLGDEGDAVAPV